MLLERIAKQTGRPWLREIDDAADLLYVLTSFATYDTLAVPGRSRDQVTRLVQRAARQALS